MKHSEDKWRALEKYLREEGPPPSGLAARQARLEDEALPEHLDARVLREIRTAAAGEDGTPARLTRTTPAVRRLFPAAAALLILTGAAAWFAFGVWQPRGGFPVRVLSAAGPISDSRNESEFRLSEIGADALLPPASRLELKRGSLLYLEYAPGFIVRLTGPAQVEFAERGLTLQNGQLDLLAQESAPESESPADSSHDSERADFLQVHEGFRLRTARAEYRLLGTCLRMRSGPERDRLQVLEGAVAVSPTNGGAVQIGAGQSLQLSEAQSDASATGAVPLGADERRALDAMRLSLARFVGADGAARPNAGAGTEASVSLSIEDLRAIYGSVMRFELRGGRSLVGSMVRTAEGDFIHTVDGLQPVQSADVLSFQLVE